MEYTPPILRNFLAKDLDELLIPYFSDEKSYHSLKRKLFESSTFFTIPKIIEEKQKEGIDFKNLSEVLLKEVTSILPDQHYVFKFNYDKNEKDFYSHIKKDLISFIDAPISNRNLHLKTEEIQLVSITKENNSYTFLIRNGYTLDEEEEKSAVFFIACEFNFQHNFFMIKLRDNQRKKAKIPISTLFENLFKLIKSFVPKEIEFLNYTKETVERKLYEIFNQESLLAEKIIKSKLPINYSNLQNKLSTFINNDLKLKKTSFADNIRDLEYFYYKNIAKDLPTTTFNARYIFAFSFFDGKTTKSNTRDASRSHIYSKDLYWNLKSLVHKEEKITELSIYYKINNKDFTKEPSSKIFIGLEITFKPHCNAFLIDFYNTKRRDANRGYQSEFILYELKKYL